MLINAVGIIIYVISCLFILKREKRLFVFFSLISFLQLWTLVSCFYNDLGIYNIELTRYTEPTLATFRLAMLYLVFNLGFLLTGRLLSGSHLTRIDYRLIKETLRLGMLKPFLYGGVTLVILYIGYGFLTGGIPVFSGFGKLSYFQEAGRVEQILLLYGFIFAFILGYFRPENEKFSLSSLIIFLYVVFLILTGNKFSKLMLLLACYYAPIYARHYLRTPDLKLFRKKHLLVGLVIVVLLTGLVIGSYFSTMGEVSLARWYFFNRVFAFQGEMWWAADHDYFQGDLYDDGHWKKEFDAVVSPGEVSSTDVGMEYLMIRILGPEKAYAVIEKGYLYTMTYPGILIATFPYPFAFFIQLFAGAVLYLLLYYQYYTIVYKHFVRALISLTILIPLKTVLTTGNAAVFLTPEMALKILLLIILEMGDFRRRLGKAGG